MLYAKALKRAMVKALKGRKFRPPESPPQAVCDTDEVNCLLFVTKFLQLFIFLGL